MTSKGGRTVLADVRHIVRCVLQAQVGAAEAFNQLLRRIQQPLFRCIAGIVCDSAQAEDVYRELKWLREPSLFRPWAYRIATRRPSKN